MNTTTFGDNIYFKAMPAQQLTGIGKILGPLRPIHRIFFSLLIGLIVFFSLQVSWPVLMKALVGWLAFSISYLLMAWGTIFTMPIDQIVKKAGEEDGSKVYIFFFVLSASLACMLGVLIITITSNDNDINKILLVSVTVLSMILSWALVHTLFVFHYAHLYYKKGVAGSGLDFPGEEKPDYMDFAYFSFVLGCTFQVSDVEISSKRIRRVAFFHGLLSFALNTFVVALTINIVAGLIK